MNELPRRIDLREAREKMQDYDAAIKFMNLQAHVRVLMHTGAYVSQQDQDRFWNTYYQHFHE